MQCWEGLSRSWLSNDAPSLSVTPFCSPSCSSLNFSLYPCTPVGTAGGKYWDRSAVMGQGTNLSR